MKILFVPYENVNDLFNINEIRMNEISEKHWNKKKWHLLLSLVCRSSGIIDFFFHQNSLED
jgi:hypothetical protein